MEAFRTAGPTNASAGGSGRARSFCIGALRFGVVGIVSVALAVAGGVAPAGASGSRADVCTALSRGWSRLPTGGAAHVVVAISTGYSSNRVKVTECTRTRHGWRKGASVSGRAGYNGFARPGRKREGDGKSPTGSYPMRSAFGMADPGTALPYRVLRAHGDCWGSTPGKSHYNAYYSGHCRRGDEDLSAEMRRGPYRQAVVIGYNLPRPTSGLGSAIFFHVGGVTATAGCISINESTLRAIMRTLVPGDRMLMGPESAVFRRL
jgi:L,D-peptidoglycan transpeptidase YkuD (ErfK/YbiS/YcfS/YnhG family)